MSGCVCVCVCVIDVCACLWNIVLCVCVSAIAKETMFDFVHFKYISTFIFQNEKKNWQDMVNRLLFMNIINCTLTLLGTN